MTLDEVSQQTDVAVEQLHDIQQLNLPWRDQPFDFDEVADLSFCSTGCLRRFLDAPDR